MIRMAIVEDDQKTAALIQTYVDRYAAESGRTVRIHRFNDGYEIATEYKLDYDIILMDIQMKVMDGMTAARKIRARDSEVVIIFVTNMAQYAIQGYEVSAADYILKPIQYFSFAEKLNRAVRQKEKKERHYLSVSVDRGMVKLAIDEIRYIESQGHKITFYTGDEMYYTHSITLKMLEEQLQKFPFYRCNKGCLVNLEYVEAVKDGCAIVEGKKLLISRMKKNDFLEQLTNHIAEKVN